MHINDVRKHQADKEHLMRHEGKHPNQHRLVDRVVEAVKDTLNERVNEKTGTYYTKGKAGHSDVEGRSSSGRSFGRTYDTDPSLGESYSNRKD